MSNEDVLNALKKDDSTIKDIQDSIIAVIEKKYNVQICSGSGFIMDLETGQVEFTITAGGKVFPEVIEVVNELKKRNINIFIASGDRKGSLEAISKIYFHTPIQCIWNRQYQKKTGHCKRIKTKLQGYDGGKWF